MSTVAKRMQGQESNEANFVVVVVVIQEVEKVLNTDC